MVIDSDIWDATIEDIGQLTVQFKTIRRGMETDKSITDERKRLCILQNIDTITNTLLANLLDDATNAKQKVEGYEYDATKYEFCFSSVLTDLWELIDGINNIIDSDDDMISNTTEISSVS